MTSDTQWRKVREQVFKDQKGKCWVCPKVHQSHETMHAHHAVYTYDKHLTKYLDSVENIFLLCPECHLKDHGYLTCWFKRLCAWSDKIDHGYEMEAWHEEIPMLIKDKFSYLGDGLFKRRNGI